MSRPAGRTAGWADGRALLVAIVLPSAYPAIRLSAQHVVVGPQLVVADYREVSADLHYRGSGGGATASFTWKKFGAEVSISSVKYKPTADGTAIESFTATQFDLRLRYYVTGPVTAELGIVNRKVDPEFEAQSVGAARAGARMSYVLGPGVRMAVRGGMLFGAKFSGGGSSTPIGALEVGLTMAADALRGRLRFTGDYDFQRIARTTEGSTGEVDVPIQQSVGRVGIAVAF